MEFSIIIPAFNKAELTRAALLSLERTIDRDRGEVIVVDNASSDETPLMLAEFPWVHAVRNERNAGFAVANNQGAKLARGEYLILLNNDVEAHPGWLDALLRTARSSSDVGAVGARLLYPDGTVQHAGVVIGAERFGRAAFTPSHAFARSAGNAPAVMHRRDFQALTAACLLTPRELFLQTGGLDCTFWNGYEDVDYCLRLRAMGRRIVYEPQAVLTHFESQSGPQRFRKVAWNIGALAQRWNGDVHTDRTQALLEAGIVARSIRLQRGAQQMEMVPVPPATVIVHGDVADREAMEAALRAGVHTPIARIDFVSEGGAVASARQEMELRGDRFLALVTAKANVHAGWLDELVAQVSFSPSTGAASFVPEAGAGEDVQLAAADARCTLLHLQAFPQHERLRALPSLDEAVAEFLSSATALRVATRGVSRPIADLPPCRPELRAALLAGRPAIEERLRAAQGRRPGLVSIVMLSWNAPQFTKMALESIRAYTRGDYEIVIVDNGSGDETVNWLRTLHDQPDVRVIYNPVNLGYAGGNNQAIAAARGEYVVLLNNDVIVTEGWLEKLLRAFDRVPNLGVSAPRSNKIAGDQIVSDAAYDGIDGMHEFARIRSERYRDQGYMTDRAIGLCLCIDRRVIDEVGGIDERFGVGNFEDDDFCMRVRAAGYRIFVCDDVFIHHFGSQTFAANKVDWTATMRENWTKFAAKWSLPAQQVNGGYHPDPAIRRGFAREKHYVPLPQARKYRFVFAAQIHDDEQWQELRPFVKRYLRAFDAGAPVQLAIASFAQPDARTIGSRIERMARKEGLHLDRIADIDVCDEDSVDAWLASLSGDHRIDVTAVANAAPGALRRMVEAPLA